MLPLVYEFKSLVYFVSRLERFIPPSRVPKANSHVLRPSKDVTLLEWIPCEAKPTNGFR